MPSIQADSQVFVVVTEMSANEEKPGTFHQDNTCGRLQLLKMQIHLKEKAENVPELQSFLKASFLFVWLVGYLSI